MGRAVSGAVPTTRGAERAERYAISSPRSVRSFIFIGTDKDSDGLNSGFSTPTSCGGFGPCELLALLSPGPSEDGPWHTDEELAPDFEDLPFGTLQWQGPAEELSRDCADLPFGAPQWRAAAEPEVDEDLVASLRAEIAQLRRRLGESESELATLRALAARPRLVGEALEAALERWPRLAQVAGGPSGTIARRLQLLASYLDGRIVAPHVLASRSWARATVPDAAQV